MTRNQITSVALKFFAIYGIFNLIMAIPTLINLITYSDFFGNKNENQVYITLLLIILAISSLSFCIWLIWRLSNSIVKSNSETVKSSDDLANEILKVIFIGMGFYFVVTSATSLPYLYTNFLIKGEDDPNRYLYQVNIATTAIKLLLGCFLVAKPSQWVKAIRSLGQSKSEQVD